jgi:hypothetical protein
MQPSKFTDQELKLAGAAWDTALRSLAEERAGLAAGIKARGEVRRFRDKTRRAWDKLSDDAKDQVEWTAKYMGCCAPASAFFQTLDEAVATIVGKRGNKGQAQSVTPKDGHSGAIKLDAIRAVAKALGLKGYGSGDRGPVTEKTLTARERKLLAICRGFDPRVTPVHVRSALKGLAQSRSR